MYQSSTGSAMTMEQAGWLLKEALEALGYKETSDKIWGANICSNMCWSNYPCAEDSESYPGVEGGYSGGRSCWRLIENWWMLKKKDYGSCVDSSDYRTKDLCGTKSTCRDRIKRMGQIVEHMGQATALVLATLINMADEQERERYLLATESSSQAVLDAAVAMQHDYGEYMHQQVLKQKRKERLLASGFSDDDAEWISESLDGTAKALVLVDKYSYSPSRATSIIGSARDQGRGSLQRAYARAVWWAKYWIWVLAGAGTAIGGSVLLYSNRDKIRGSLAH
jgi:hypothetical protein